MIDRKQQVRELIESFQCLRHRMALRSPASAHLPRITPSQWGVLMLIEGRGESTVKDVARALDITSSAATQLIDGLVRSGYMLRKALATDRRAVSLVLSKKTKTQVGRMKQQALRNFLKFFEVLNDKEFGRYTELNKKIVERFSKDEGVKTGSGSLGSVV